MGTIVLLVIIICIAIAGMKLEREGFFDNQKINLKIPQRQKPFVQLLDSGNKDPNRVGHDNTPLHIKRGWEQSGNTYRGYYRTLHGAWRGEINRKGDKFKVMIFKPPLDQLKRHSRWICMHKEGNGRYRIDLAKNPGDKDIGAIIFYVENLIIDSFQMT